MLGIVAARRANGGLTSLGPVHLVPTPGGDLSPGNLFLSWTQVSHLENQYIKPVDLWCLFQYSAFMSVHKMHYYIFYSTIPEKDMIILLLTEAHGTCVDKIHYHL